MSNREDNTTASPSSFVVTEKVQCLISSRRGRIASALGFNPLRAAAFEGVVNELRNEHDFEIVRELESRRSAKNAVDGEASNVYVARIGVEAFLRLRAQAQATRPELVIELDAELDYSWAWAANPATIQSTLVERLRQDRMHRSLGAGKGSRAQVRFKVVGDNDEPVPNAQLQFESAWGREEAVTDQNGEASLNLTAAATSSARSLFVDPTRDYWSQYFRYPNANSDGDNLVRLRSLGKSLRDANGASYGWGQRFIGLDQLPPSLDGRGAKIAIIDSGVNNAHPLLRHIQLGADFSGDGSRSGWTEDLVGHGSHSSGIIAARSTDAVGLRGFAQQAEVHVLKVFPGGRQSSLIEALDYCIEKQIDVVNLGLGSSDVSEALERKLEEAVEHGIALIAAAGDSGGPVQYPASSPQVLSVAAIGVLGEFPAGSWEAQTIPPFRELWAADGVFAPGFSALGAKIDLSAPGVGIISAAPGEGLAARSGTSVAAAHASGLAALLIAHHPWFKSVLGAHNAQRVSGLYQLLREAVPPASSTAYQRQLGPERVGMGVPLAQRVLLGLQAASAVTGLGNAGGPIAQHGFASFGAQYGAAPAQVLYRPY